MVFLHENKIPECETCRFWTRRRSSGLGPFGDCSAFQGYLAEELEKKKADSSVEFRLYHADEITDNLKEYESEVDAGLYTKIEQPNQIQCKRLKILTSPSHYCSYYKAKYLWDETNFSGLKVGIIFFLISTLFCFILILIHMFYSGFKVENLIPDMILSIFCGLLFIFFAMILWIIFEILFSITTPFFNYLQRFRLNSTPRKTYYWSHYLCLGSALFICFILSCIIIASSIYGIAHFWRYLTSS